MSVFILLALTCIIMLLLSIVLVEILFIWIYLKDGGTFPLFWKYKEVRFKLFVNNIKSNYYKITESDYDVYYDDTFKDGL